MQMINSSLESSVAHSPAPLSAEIQSAILSGPIIRPEIARIPIKESGEPIRSLDRHDIRVVSTGDPRFGNNRIPSGVEPKMRAAVYDKLLEAIKLLPSNTGIAVFEGLRPLKIQRQYFDAKVQELIEIKHLSKPDAVKEASKWVTNPDGASGLLIFFYLLSTQQSRILTF